MGSNPPPRTAEAAAALADMSHALGYLNADTRPDTLVFELREFPRGVP